jgi:HD-GYP domain-containing protein (c-di-GMP phosphodiesterase class II)
MVALTFSVLLPLRISRQVSKMPIAPESGPPPVMTKPGGEVRRYEARIRELESQNLDFRRALVCSFNQLLDLRDLNTGVHSTRLAEWALYVARDLGVPENCMSDLEMGALLHDIGKIGVPDTILNKAGKLSSEEYEFVKRHPEFGWNVIRNLPGFEKTGQYVLHHHENFDGTGYPARLKGSEIPTGARIVSVIDAFDAMVSSRPYRTGLPVEEAIRRLNAASGTQFDPAVISSFVPLAQSEMASVLEAVGVAESGAF